MNLQLAIYSPDYTDAVWPWVTGVTSGVLIVPFAAFVYVFGYTSILMSCFPRTQRLWAWCTRGRVQAPTGGVGRLQARLSLRRERPSATACAPRRRTMLQNVDVVRQTLRARSSSEQAARQIR